MIKSIKFPDMFSYASTNIVEDYDATLQNLKLLLYTTARELFGDPYYGNNLKKKLFDQNYKQLQDILIDDIYSSIQLFLPQVVVTRKDITLEYQNENVFINIRAKNKLDYQTNLYQINMIESGT